MMRHGGRKVDCLVIGGGLAGAMAGIRLAEAGREVVLLEREREARPKVCGEFLSAEALAYLRQCEIEPQALGARPVERVRLCAGSRTVEAALPFAAMALSRVIADEEMLRRAINRGCDVRRDAAVDSVAGEPGEWIANTRDGQTVRAANVFLATGKHDVRGRGRAPGRQNDLIGMKMRWRVAPDQGPPLARAIELALFPGGYGGLVEVEDGSVNLSLVVKQSVFRSLGGWPELLEHIRKRSSLFARRLCGAEPLWDRPMAISKIPYGYVAREVDGLWRVGDQAAVIPSFTGDGMAIALHSSALAVEFFLAGKGVEAYQASLSNQLRGGMALATTLSRLMASPMAGVLAPAATALLPMALGSIARATRIPSNRLVLRGSQA